MAAPEYLHLEAKANNSLFGLAFQGVGVFDKGKAEAPDLPRTLILLSDGLSEAPGEARQKLDELKQAGVMCTGLGLLEILTSGVSRMGLPFACLLRLGAGVLPGSARSEQKVITQPSGRWPSSGFGFCFAAGKIARLTMKPNTCRHYWPRASQNSLAIFHRT
jgi:hypothetical protein